MINNQIEVVSSENYEPITVLSCTQCDQSFEKEEELEAHINLVHQKAFTCKLCNSGFSNMGNLKRHHMLQHSHLQVTKYVCLECKKSFNYSSSLAKHMRIHKNIRNYVCDHCAKTFIHKNGLEVVGWTYVLIIYLI